MKVALEKSFAIPASADAAWGLLRDIEKLAACMPGAMITERVDDANYKGTVAVKFGPANMAFRGEIQVAEVTPATRTVRLIGKGVDSTGSSGASMDLTARLTEIDAASCTLLGTSEVSVSGKAAAFGGRMMSAVADQVLKQFATNFATRVQEPGSAPSSTAGESGTNLTSTTQTAAQAVIRPIPAPTAPAVAPAEQLNGLALAWAVFADWLRSLFVARKA